MPAKQALNQVIIEESWERFDKEMGLDANMTVGGGVFSIDVNASQLQQLRCKEEAYYALRNSFIPLWTVYLPNVTAFSDLAFDADVPTPFRHADRSAYEQFFERYGTHYVKRVWVGKGGDELKLAALSSLDEKRYNEWLTTIKENPQIIELEVSGIWTLINDKEKAKALQDAYREATTFKAISAVFAIGKEIFFMRGYKYFCYHTDKGESEKPRPVIEKWPVLSQAGFERIDAALRRDGEDWAQKLILFRRNKYICLNIETGSIDDGYPRPTADGWPGVTFDRIDAALSIAPDSIYFFKGNEYIRYDTSQEHAEEEYPDIISTRWAGVTFNRIDAAIYWGNGKVYFFRGDHPLRYGDILCGSRVSQVHHRQLCGRLEVF